MALEVLDASTLTVSLLTAAAWLPWLVIGLPAGAWLDRLPKRPVLVTTDVVSAVLMLRTCLGSSAAGANSRHDPRCWVVNWS